MSTCSVCSKVSAGQCSKCHQVGYCSTECQKKDWTTHREICGIKKSEKIEQHVLDSQQTDELVEIIKQYVNIYKVIYLLDQVEADSFKERNQYYFTQKHKDHEHHHDDQSGHGKCCSASFNHVYSPKQEQSVYEKHLSELLSPSSLKGGLLTEILNSCGKNFFNIKNNGIKDGLAWNQENEVYLLGKVMQEGLTMFFVNKLKSVISDKQRVDSKQPMLYANAATWKAKYPTIQLNFLDSAFIQSLSEKGYASQNRYLQDSKYFLQQLNWVQKDGKFQQSLVEPNVRNDRHLWISSVDGQHYPQISKLIKYMSAIQFQINSKTSLSCSISEMWMISYFKSSGFHKKHHDSRMTVDSGKKFTVLVPLEKIQVVLYEFEDSTGTTLEIQANSLFVLKSRIFAYEIKCPNPKTFMLRYWINGPKQPEA